MLLLLRAPPTGPVSASLGGAGSLAASGSTVSATLAGTGTFSVGGSIELNLFATLAGAGSLVGISSGFVTRSASFPGAGALVARGGYSTNLALNALGNLTGTVGSTLQGTAQLQGIGALADTGILAGSSSALAGSGALVGAASISGGTVTPSASLSGNGLLTVTTPAYIAAVNLDGTGALTGTGFPNIVGLATQMRVSFSSDQIRLFFRKG